MKKMQDKEQFKKVLHNMAENLAEKYDLPGWGDAMEAQFMKWAVNWALDKFTGTEKTRTEKPLSEEAEKGLWAYMNGPPAGSDQHRGSGQYAPGRDLCLRPYAQSLFRKT